MKRISLVLAAAAVACWFAPGGGAATFTGAVVGRDAARGAIAIASKSGAVHTIRVHKQRRLGAQVIIAAARKPDGTFSASHVTARGHTSHARIHGVVVRRTAARTFLSAGGTVLAVRGANRAMRPGRIVTMEVSIRGNALHGVRIIAAGSSAFIEVEGTIATLSPLAIALDHGATIRLTVPAALTLPAGLAVGDEVEAVVEFSDGVYTLVTLQTDQEAEQGNNEDNNDNEVEASGKVTAMGSGTLTVQTRHGASVMFTVPAGFDLTGVTVGSSVEAKGVKQGTTVTLTRIKVEDQGDDGGDGGGGDGDHGGDGHHGGGGDGDG
jgi:hypothetical protein